MPVLSSSTYIYVYAHPHIMVALLSLMSFFLYPCHFIYCLFLMSFFAKPGESLRDFYRRTNLYWQMAAHEHTQHTGKVCSCNFLLTGLYFNFPRINYILLLLLYGSYANLLHPPSHKVGCFFFFFIWIKKI